MLLFITPVCDSCFPHHRVFVHSHTVCYVHQQNDNTISCVRPVSVLCSPQQGEKKLHSRSEGIVLHSCLTIITVLNRLVITQKLFQRILSTQQSSYQSPQIIAQRQPPLLHQMTFLHQCSRTCSWYSCASTSMSTVLSPRKDSTFCWTSFVNDVTEYTFTGHPCTNSSSLLCCDGAGTQVLNTML